MVNGRKLISAYKLDTDQSKKGPNIPGSKDLNVKGAREQILLSGT